MPRNAKKNGHKAEMTSAILSATEAVGTAVGKAVGRVERMMSRARLQISGKAADRTRKRRAPGRRKKAVKR
jgi:hypothetical protein